MSTAVVVGALVWLVVALDGGASRRRVVLRVQTLGRPSCAGHRPTFWADARSRTARVGQLVGSRVRDQPWLLVGCALPVVVGPVPVLLVAAGGAVLWWARRRSRCAGRRRRIRHELPDLVDLLHLAVGAGLTPRLAVASLVDHGDGLVVDALGRALDATSRGRRLAEALEGVRQIDPVVSPLIDALVAAERHGAPLSAAVDRLAADARADRRRQLEEAARRVPVRLLLPLVACILPSVGLLTVVPIALAALGELSP